MTVLLCLHEICHHISYKKAGAHVKLTYGTVSYKHGDLTDMMHCTMYHIKGIFSFI